MIRCCTAIVLVALTPAACADDAAVPSDSGPVQSELTLDAAAAPAVGTELFVKYYLPACESDATQSADEKSGGAIVASQGVNVTSDGVNG